MVSETCVIKNPTGLHLRPAGFLCKESMKFKSSIHFQYKTAAKASFSSTPSHVNVISSPDFTQAPRILRILLS